MQKKKKKLLLAPCITETSTEEDLVLADDFKKQRFTALIMRSVCLGLMLLSLLFSLFIPYMKRDVKDTYDTDYSFTISVADELGYFSANNALKADIDSFTKNGGLELINTESEIDRYKSASEQQILADVAYKRTLSFSKVKAVFDVESFIAGVGYRMGRSAQEIRKLFPEDKANELISDFYAEQKIAVGAVFDLFSYEIERNNYAGLREYLLAVESDLSETTSNEMAEKFLLGNYKWSETFKTTLNAAVNAAGVMPELQDEFRYLGGELTRFANNDSYVLQMLPSWVIIFIDVILLIILVVGGISLYKEFRSADVTLHGAEIGVLLFLNILFHILTFPTSGARLIGAVGAGLIVIELFLILTIVAYAVNFKYLTKMKNKFASAE